MLWLGLVLSGKFIGPQVESQSDSSASLGVHPHVHYPIPTFPSLGGGRGALTVGWRSGCPTCTDPPPGPQAERFYWKKKGGAVLGLCFWTLETRGTTQPSPQGQRASASAAGSSCRSDRRRLAHDRWVTAPVSKLLCKVWVLRWAFRAGAGGWTLQRLGGEAPARVGVTHLHTGHLQVPLSQFSCRYDSRSKHCRGRETGRQTRR